MLIVGVTGIRPAAAAWSTNEEERRKALLSYFLYGLPYILWDNIARKTMISCPHIERSCTAAYYSDRKLGVSEMVATAAATIHLFTGNNIGPRGDLASRSLSIRLSADRADPENRAFTHPDPVGWTDDHRGEILRAFYTILLGNPTLKRARNAPMKTRFKMWWRLVGSAVEHAAKLHVDSKPKKEAMDYPKLDFEQLFLTQEESGDEDSISLADALDLMLKKWPKGFHAADVTSSVNNGFGEGLELREFLYPRAPPNQVFAARSVGKQLAKHIDEPVKAGDRTLILRKRAETGGPAKGTLAYHVEEKGKKAEEFGMFAEFV